MPLLLISGQPGAGKSTFCRWLVHEKGYAYVETDAEWNIWGSTLTEPGLGSAREVHNRLRQRGPDVVIEWGFHPDLLHRIRELIIVGLEHWWFRADEAAAFQQYLNRSGDVSEEAYRIQLERITHSFAMIEKVYRGRMLEVLEPDGTRMPYDEILTMMLGITRHPPGQ